MYDSVLRGITLALICSAACGESGGDAPTTSASDVTSESSHEASSATEAASTSGTDTDTDTDTNTDTDTDTDTDTESGETTTGIQGCDLPAMLSHTGHSFDVWAYLCYDHPTGACSLVPGMELELDPCGGVSSGPAIQFFNGISAGELSLRQDPLGSNPWTFLSASEGTVSDAAVTDFPFDADMVVTLSPPEDDTVYEIRFRVTFQGTAIANIESFEIVG